MPSSLGGGVVIAFAAVLWLLYLTPSWLRRRQYLHTERTAVRLQQTLRVLAETAEVPNEIRAEVSARSIADQHRALREAARRAESSSRGNAAAAERALARQGGPRAPQQRALAASAIASGRLRRSRVLAANLLVVGLTLGGWGVQDLMADGSWGFFAAGVVTVLAALALLQRASMVAAATRAVEAVDHAIVVPDEPRSFTDWQRTERERPRWTPVPLPKPLYLDREEAAAPERDRVALAASLQAAAKRADDALRAAHAAPEVAALDGGKPYAGIGAVHETGPVMQDLDGVLRRRRTA